jgi:hypothetical protein
VDKFGASNPRTSCQLVAERVHEAVAAGKVTAEQAQAKMDACHESGGVVHKELSAKR